MQVKLQRHGSALRLTLPADVITALELDADTVLQVTVRDGVLLLEPERGLGFGASLSDIQAVHAHANRVLNLDRALTARREGIIRARLREGFTVAQLQQVATWVSGNAFLRGSNSRARSYDDYRYMYRSRERVEDYLQQASLDKLGPSDRTPTYLEL